MHNDRHPVCAGSRHANNRTPCLLTVCVQTSMASTLTTNSMSPYACRMVLPRLLRGYERLQHAAGHPKVPRARAVAPLGLALQNVLVKHEPALRHFGVRLQPFIR